MSNCDIAILGGFGHVGLPLGIALAQTGRRVVLIDIDKKAYNVIASGRMPFMEEDGEYKLRQVLNKTLFLSLDEAELAKSRYVVIVLGTPVDEHLNPNFSGLYLLFQKLLHLFSHEQHIILRSTVYPGTTEQIRKLLRDANLKTSISFCPERILQGKALQELTTLPQLIGSFDSSSAQDAANLFSSLTEKMFFLTPLEAELAKLFTNSFRYIQFAIANQFYQLCLEHSVDFYKVYQAAKADYPRMNSWPTAGFAAGPCLFKDTMQLAAFCNNNFLLGHAAMLINEGLPNFIVSILKRNYNVASKVVAILGMAFKGDIDDPRESLSYKLKKLLTIEASRVICSDPFVSDPSLVTLEDALQLADIIVIGAPHSSYRNLEIDFEKKVIIDIWNFFGKGGLF